MLLNFICFIGGIVFMWVWSVVLAMGYSSIILKQTQRSCALMFLKSEEGLQEILVLKYMAMKEAKRTEQNITAQKYIDQMNIESIKKTIMRNYLREFPHNYEHLIEFENWDQLNDYVDRITKKQGEKNDTRKR
tara:strand:- start:195 stop:593 length:399 start_codon:yes stop_codon:yes gene_type:complete